MQRVRFDPLGRPSVELKVASFCIAAIPVSAFLAIVVWFHSADIYHRQFFDNGATVVLYNVVRTAFAAVFAWLVYALGTLVLGGFRAQATGAAPLEQAVFGFATGIGALHVIMLALGVARLYDERLMIAGCVVLLAVTGPQFARAARTLTAWRTRSSPYFAATAAVVGLCAAWLLIVKGLYPGGGGDYYTHYFYYYLAVLHDHGLRPNDVWYHFYYSKGAGPTFLAMLLTDPESTEIVTYCCVAFAALAVALLSARMLPRSLWPALCAGLYLLAYIVPLGPADGGEFQKTHEETSALVVFAAWALCMRLISAPSWRKICLVTAAAALVGAAILELAAAVILAFVLACLAGWSLLRTNRSAAADYALLAGVAGISAFAMLALNYLMTGLATDQGLDVMLKFANLERLDAWGVIPQLVIVTWIRDNYNALAPPLGSGTLVELRDYLRLEFLWPLVESAVLAGCVWLVYAGRAPRPAGAPAAAPRPASGMTAPAWLRAPGIVPPNASEAAVIGLSLIAILAFTASVQQVRDGGLADIPWLVLAASVVLWWALSRRAAARRRGSAQPPDPADPARVARFLGIFGGVLALVSVPAAGSQTVSYLRFCGFFVPLVVLFVVACWGALLGRCPAAAPRALPAIVVPALLFAAALVTWQIANTWFDRAFAQTRHAVKFSVGRYSLATAYGHQSSGLAYGGIDPAVLTAFRHVPAGNRIWSTNVDSYCMVPGCSIESAVSFKMSRHLSEILSGSPARAKSLLAAEGLNYFLFATDAPNGIIDLLPFSRLFAPTTIGRYLGIRWTNGSEYLLTWRGPGVSPIDSRFLAAYSARVGGTEHPWFRFRELVEQMDLSMDRLYATPHPWHKLDFAWRRKH